MILTTAGIGFKYCESRGNALKGKSVTQAIPEVCLEK